MKYVLLLAAVILTSCNTDTSIVNVDANGNTFTIHAGQSVTIPSEHLTIGFSKVVNDSRCPAGAKCLWEGMAQLQMWMLQPSADTVFIMPAIRGGLTQSDTCCHTHIDTIGYSIKMVQLDPYPDLDAPLPIPSSEYIAYLQITKL